MVGPLHYASSTHVYYNSKWRRLKYFSLLPGQGERAGPQLSLMLLRGGRKKEERRDEKRGKVKEEGIRKIRE